MGIKTLQRQRQRGIAKQMKKFNKGEVAIVNGRYVSIEEASKNLIVGHDYTLKDRKYYWSDAFEKVKTAQDMVALLIAAAYDIKNNYTDLLKLVRPRSVVLKFENDTLLMNYDFSGTASYRIKDVIGEEVTFDVVNSSVKEEDRQMAFEAAATFLLAVRASGLDLNGLEFDNTNSTVQALSVYDIKVPTEIQEEQLKDLNELLQDRFFLFNITPAELNELANVLMNEHKTLTDELKAITDSVMDRLFYRTKGELDENGEVTYYFEKKFEWRSAEDTVKTNKKGRGVYNKTTKRMEYPDYEPTADEVVYGELFGVLQTFLTRFATNSQNLILEVTTLVDRANQIKAASESEQ